MQNNVVFSRKGKVNNKYLEKLPVDDEGVVDIKNVVHVSWDKGEAYVSVTDNLWKAVRHAEDNPDADFITDIAKTFKKLCKVPKNYEEMYWAAWVGFKMTRESYSDKNDIPTASDRSRLDYFDKSVNQVDRLFSNPNTEVLAMVDKKTGKLHKFQPH